MFDSSGMTELLLLLAIWFVVGLAISMLTMRIYENKGKSKTTGFLLGFLLGLIGLLIAIMVKDEREDALAEEQTAATRVVTSMVGSSDAASSVTPNSAYYVALFGAALIIVGSILPWITATTMFGTITKSGIDGDGKFTLLFGVLTGIGVFAGFRKPGKRAWAAAVFSFLCLAIGIIDYADVSTRIADVSTEYAFGSVGIGLYLVILGGFLGLAGFARNADLPKRAVARRAAAKTCPRCAETIRAAAQVCRYCGHEFAVAQPRREEPTAPIKEPTTAPATEPVQPTVSSASAIARPAQPTTSAPGDAPISRVCPKCGIEMLIRIAKSGPYEGKSFFICPNFSQCRQVFPAWQDA